MGAGPSQTRANSLVNRSQSCFEEQSTDRSASSIAATPAFCTMRKACKQSSVVLPEPNPLARAQRQNRTTARSRMSAFGLELLIGFFSYSYSSSSSSSSSKPFFPPSTNYPWSHFDPKSHLGAVRTESRTRTSTIWLATFLGRSSSRG